ncbi:MAG: hypothetical protein ACOCXA_06515, partial [Planctomycetota bacterium]
VDIIDDRLRNDLMGYHPSTFFHLAYEADGSQEMIFMRGFSLEVFDRGRSTGLEMDVISEYLDDYLYVAWRYEPATGILRAETPGMIASYQNRDTGGGNSPFFNTITPLESKHNHHHWSNADGSWMFGRAVVPVRHYRHFMNNGDPSRPDVGVAGARLGPWSHASDSWQAPDVYDIPPDTDTSPWDKWSHWGVFDPYMPLNGSGDGGRHYLLGDSSILHDTAHGSALGPPFDAAGTPTGQPVFHHLNRIHLLGAPADPGDLDEPGDAIQPDPYFPGTLTRVFRNVELFDIRVILRDGRELAYGGSAATYEIPGHHATVEFPVPDDRFDDGSPRPIADHADPDYSDDLWRAISGDRPGLVRVRFIMHDMPEDPRSALVDMAAEPGTINRLRAEFQNDVVPHLTPDQRHKTLQRMIEDRGFTAIVIELSYPMS